MRTSKRLSRIVIGGLSGLLLAASLVACNGGNTGGNNGRKTISHADFVAAANNICLGGQAQVGEVSAPSEASHITDNGPESLNAAEVVLEGLRKLHQEYVLPSGDETSFVQYLTLEAERVAFGRVVLKMAQADASSETISDASGKMNNLDPGIAQVTSSLELTKCNGFDWTTALSVGGLGFSGA